MAPRPLGWLLSKVVPLVACATIACGGETPPSEAASGPARDLSGGTFTLPEATPVSCSPDPKNADIPGNDCDDDGDGKVDARATCDDGLAQVGSAEELARAIGICDRASAKGYGLVSATFTRGYERTEEPAAEQHGVLSKFGDVVRPREGKRLGVLSTGYADEWNGGKGAAFGGETGGPNGIISHGKDWWGFAMEQPRPSVGNGRVPPGFPKAAPGCQQATQTNDVIDLKLVLKAPPNAKGFKFDFNFYSGEWPAYVCSPFNDGFLAYLSAKGFNNGVPNNISFDKRGAPVSVNNGFFDRCTPSTTTGCSPFAAKRRTSECPGGTAELEGTGFGMISSWCDSYESPTGQTMVNGGATGWLTSQAPVLPGETFTLELLIWDTGDALLDSSVLLDNFQWIGGSNVTTSTDRPVR